MPRNLTYTKETRTSRDLLDAGMAKIAYYESDEGRVLRTVQVLENGEMLKDSVFRPENERIGRDAVSEFAPLLPEDREAGAVRYVQDLAFIEWSSLEEFEEVFARARLMGEI